MLIFGDTPKYLVLHMEQIENLLILGVPILKNITVLLFPMLVLMPSTWHQVFKLASVLRHCADR